MSARFLAAFGGRGPANSRQPSAWVGLMVLLVAVVTSLMLAVVSIMANPIVVALATTAVLAPMLGYRPQTALWILLAGGLLVAGVVPIWSDGQASRAVWGLSALSFFLLFVLLGRAMVSAETRRDTPAFVWLFLVFAGYACVVSLLRWDNTYQALSGFKRYFQALGVMVAFAWLAHSDRQMGSIRRFILIVALVQLPWAAYELIRLVPIRQATRMLYPGMIPIDVVAGTFGANLTKGGANGEMATFLVIVLGFMLSRVRHRVEGASRALWLAPIVALPLFMGETKVVVVLIPLMFITLYRRTLLSRPLVGLGGLVLGAALTVGVTAAYLAVANKDLQTQINDTLDYNVRDRGYGSLLLNRTSVLTHWVQERGLADPVSPVLGNGLGSAHDATGGSVARRYPGFGVGLTTISILLWEQGLVGVIILAASMWSAWRTAARIARQSVEHWVRADAEALQAALPLFVAFALYRPALLEGFPFQLLFFGLLGYLAWLARREAARRSAE